MDTRATIEELLERAFSMRSVLRLHSKGDRGKDYENKGCCKKICHDPEEAWRHDELIGGKLPGIQ
jgi:hypothetical protein